MFDEVNGNFLFPITHYYLISKLEHSISVCLRIRSEIRRYYLTLAARPGFARMEISSFYIYILYYILLLRVNVAFQF